MLLLVVVAAVAATLSVDARACDAIGSIPHIVDTSMQATDHEPAHASGDPAAMTHYEADSSNGVGCGLR
jgi:hypothetical protein